MGATTTSSTTPRPNARQHARAQRVQEIRDAARVRAIFGQAALYERVDGGCEIIFKGQRFSAATLDAAIDAAQGVGANT